MVNWAMLSWAMQTWAMLWWAMLNWAWWLLSNPRVGGGSVGGATELEDIPGLSTNIIPWLAELDIFREKYTNCFQYLDFFIRQLEIQFYSCKILVITNVSRPFINKNVSTVDCWSKVEAHNWLITNACILSFPGIAVGRSLQLLLSFWHFTNYFHCILYKLRRPYHHLKLVQLLQVSVLGGLSEFERQSLL